MSYNVCVWVKRKKKTDEEKRRKKGVRVTVTKRTPTWFYLTLPDLTWVVSQVFNLPGE